MLKKTIFSNKIIQIDKLREIEVYRFTGLQVYRFTGEIGALIQMQKSPSISAEASLFGATHEVRTRDLNLGKVALYQLS